MAYAPTSKLPRSPLSRLLALLLASAMSVICASMSAEDLEGRSVEGHSAGEAQSDAVDLEGGVLIPSDDGDLEDFVPPVHKPMTLEERYRHAEWVSLVKVDNIGALINPALSKSASYTVMQAYNYDVSVIRGWKGDATSTLKFRVDLSDCRQALARDGEYLVFGVINAKGDHQSLSCEDLIDGEEAQPLMATLDQFSAARLAQSP